jgi:hypothetical protein
MLNELLQGRKIRNEPFLDESLLGWSIKNIGEKRGSEKALVLISVQLYY